MNYKKFLYKVERKLYRRWQHPSFFINDNIKIAFNNAHMQTLIIASKMYHEKDTPCQTMDLKTREWKDDIIKANRETKEEFEGQKAIDIAQVWCDFAIAVTNIYCIAFTGEKSNLKFNFKDEFIQIFIRQLKELNE